jgi:hypothetical protein
MLRLVNPPDELKKKMINTLANPTKTDISIKLKFIINVTPKLINPMMPKVTIKLMILPIIITPF